MSLIRNVKALCEVALDELWALFTRLVMNQGRDDGNPVQPKGRGRR